MAYTMDNATWTDYGWDNNIFSFSYGDFVDADGDEFYFLVEYKKKADKFVFFMVFEYDELVYQSGNTQVDLLFERYMSVEIMEATKEYMRKLMR